MKTEEDRNRSNEDYIADELLGDYAILNTANDSASGEENTKKE